MYKIIIVKRDDAKVLVSKWVVEGLIEGVKAQIGIDAADEIIFEPPFVNEDVMGAVIHEAFTQALTPPQS